MNWETEDTDWFEIGDVSEQGKEKAVREYLIRVFKLYLHYLWKDIRRKWNL